jgi:preprotein translocase subunit SecD
VVPHEESDVYRGFLLVEREPVITGLDVRDASAVSAKGEDDNYSVAFTIKPEAAHRFGQWTGANVNRYLAIVLNGKAHTTPYIRSAITDSGEITGNFTRQQAEDVALTLRSGNLPARLEVLEEGTYKP